MLAAGLISPVLAPILGGALAIGGGVNAYRQGGLEGLGDYAAGLAGGAVGFYAGSAMVHGTTNLDWKGQPRNTARTAASLRADNKPNVSPSKQPKLTTNYDLEGKPKSFNLLYEDGGQPRAYRQGVFGNETTGQEGTFIKGRQWAPENPASTPSYAQKYGLPAENSGSPDWIVGGRVRGEYGLGPAPGSHNNPANTGGAIEIRPNNPNDVVLDWFHMPSKE